MPKLRERLSPDGLLLGAALTAAAVMATLSLACRNGSPSSLSCS